MKFTIALSALAATAFAAPTPATVEKDISSVSSNLKIFDTDLKAYHSGDINAAVKLQNQAQTLNKSLQTATSDVKASAPFSATDANKIGDEVEALIPVVKTTLAEVVAKKADFTKDGFKSLVLSTLKSQKTSVDDFASAVMAKVPKADVSRAKADEAKIDGYFNSAIKAYSS